MSIERLKTYVPDSAKDIKLNLTNVFSEEGATDLKKEQILGIALACAYATKNPVIMSEIFEEAGIFLTENAIHAAKIAATIMAMNNIYYRFVHLVSDKSFSTMPAKLRMTAMVNPGVEKLDFELMCLAVSALSGCGMCMDAHTNELIKSGATKLAIQSAIRIAAVLNAVNVAVEMESAS